jgi:hypothetical protein
MKNIFKLFFTISIASVFLISCDEDVAFDALTKAPDPNATYYVQFLDASKTLETGVTESGDLVEATSTIAVSIMGLPQSQDIVINLDVDPGNTLTSGMYQLSANSITIPAGKTSGSVTFSTIASKMPVGQTLKFVLNINAGENNSPSSTGTVLTYNVKRIEFCPLENGVASLVGSWSGTDGQGDYTFPSQVTTDVKGDKLAVSGLSVGFINGFWGEAVIDGGTFEMTVKGNGEVVIPRQYIYTTEYEGAPYDYEVEGTGKWENCGSEPVLIINYDIYYPGDESGLAKQYNSYLGGIAYLTANINLTGAKSAEVFQQVPLNKVVK